MTDPAAPPTISPAAAMRWQRRPVPATSAWLHEEVARRMEERLEWIRIMPAHWVHWHPLAGGIEGHALLRRRYPKARCTVVENVPAWQAAAAARCTPRWWQPARWRPTLAAVQVGTPAAGSAQMVWANMALHASAEPQALIARWHDALASDGFLMFSAFGPDTLSELRAVYAEAGWGPPGCDFTDMHDWGDMLVQAGFAEPVMDMERMVLTWGSAEALLAELRSLGANFHPGRFDGLRTPRWRERLLAHLSRALADPGHGGRLALSFEIVYGHAFKPVPRAAISAESSVSLEQMRGMLRRGRGQARPG